MSRFSDSGYEYDGPAITWEMWERNVRLALGSTRGQAALAQVEEALLALPAPRLVRGHLVAKDQVCTVGALLVHRRATEEHRTTEEIIALLSADVYCTCTHDRTAHPADGPCTATWQSYAPGRPTVACECSAYEVDDDDENGGLADTKGAGVAMGLTPTLAEHLAYLNDEEFRSCTPEERYARVLAWVRRAQGKPDEVAA